MRRIHGGRGYRGAFVACWLVACSSDDPFRTTGDASAPDAGRVESAGASSGSAGTGGDGTGGATASTGGTGGRRVHQPDAGVASGGTDGGVDGGLIHDAHGTWVLALEKGDEANVLNAFSDVPTLTGISARFPWATLTEDFPMKLDFWRGVASNIKLPDGRHPELAIRFMAGRSTPATVIASAPVDVVDDPDAGAPVAIPSPCLRGGAPNHYFEDAYMAFLDQVTSWANENDVTIVHLPWYGNKWDELYVGPEVVEACGDQDAVKAGHYAETNLVKAHEHLFDLVLPYAKAHRLRIEFPLSGQGGVAPYEKVLALYIGQAVESAGMHRRVFLQSNAWGLDGGIPMTTFWACQPTLHAFQELSTKTPEADWSSLYGAIRSANATYVEVYLPSFFESNSDALAEQVAAFAPDRGPWTSCP